jgi:hypothetical protein
MDMGEMEHSCPHTVPEAAGGGWYASEVVFIMAGTWSDTIIASDGVTSPAYTFPGFAVAETGMAQSLMVGDEKWMVAFDIAGEPVLGANSFVLTVHRREDAMSFPEVPDLTVSVVPWMPAMDHGSNGNVDPVYTGDGKYEGTVVFSMNGIWEVALKLVDGAGTEAMATFVMDI